MKVKEMRLDELKPYEHNPRDNDAAVGPVANSIREFGFQQPIVCDAEGTIIVGHTRYRAAEALGLDTVPVLVAEDLTPEQCAAYRLADNRVGELATWDHNALGEELGGLTSIDMEDFGFEPFVDIADFGEDFTLPDAEAPQHKTVTLNMTETMRRELDAAVQSLDYSSYTDGDDTANGLLEIMARWREAIGQ